MKYYVGDLEKDTLENKLFRKVVFTSKNCQLVLMRLLPGEEIGEETHDLDQFFRVEAGKGLAVLDGEKNEIRDGSSVIVPAGLKHNIINISENSDLLLYTIYTPPEHKKETTHKTKAEAEADHDHEFDGRTSLES